MSTPSLYNAIRDHDFSETTCFLCGSDVENNQSSREHVFPKWLLHHFGLWDKPITLLNGTKLAYRQLVIPCCQYCNNECLSSVEREVHERFLKGAAELAAMETPQGINFSVFPMAGLSLSPVFGTWEAEDMAQMLMFFFRIPVG